MVCGVLAALMLPIAFGPIGIIWPWSRRPAAEPLWKVGLGVAIAGMVLGFIFGLIGCPAADALGRGRPDRAGLRLADERVSGPGRRTPRLVRR